MTRYIIIGAGAVGVTFAAELQGAGRDVVVAARGAQLAALRAGTMRYHRPDGSRTLGLPAAAAPDELELTPADLLVLATKTQDAEPAAADWAWRPVRYPDGSQRTAAASLPIVTLQNGLEAERSLLRRFATVLGGVLWVPATYLRPGEVSSAGARPPGSSGSAPFLTPGRRSARARGAPDGDRGGLPGGQFRDPGGRGHLPVEGRQAAEQHHIRSRRAVRAGRAARSGGPAATRGSPEILTAAGQLIADMTAESTVDLSRFTAQPIPGQERGTSSWQSLTRSGSLETDFLTGEIVLAARLIGRRAPASAAVMERVHRAQLDGIPARSLGSGDLLEVLPQLRGEPPDPSGVLIDAKTRRPWLRRRSPRSTRSASAGWGSTSSPE